MEDRLPDPNNVFNIGEKTLFDKIETLKTKRDDIKKEHPEIFSDKKQFIALVSNQMTKDKANKIIINAIYSEKIPTHIVSEFESLLKKLSGK